MIVVQLNKCSEFSVVSQYQGIDMYLIELDIHILRHNYYTICLYSKVSF